MICFTPLKFVLLLIGIFFFSFITDRLFGRVTDETIKYLIKVRNSEESEQ